MSRTISGPRVIRPNGVASLAERDDRAARQPEPTLGRLVRVGRGPDDDLLATPRASCQLAGQHLDEVGLDPDRRPVAGVRGAVGDPLEGAHEAERALVRAAHVRVERPGERHVPDAIERRPAGLVPVGRPHRRMIEQMFSLSRSLASRAGPAPCAPRTRAAGLPHREPLRAPPGERRRHRIPDRCDSQYEVVRAREVLAGVDP